MTEEISICIKNGDQTLITIPFQCFIVHSKLFAQQAYQGNFERTIDYENEYVNDSIFQFFKACQDQEPEITPDNVFGYYSLCDQWKVDEPVFKYAKDYLKDNGQKLLINHLLFELDHNQDSSVQKEQLKQNLPNYIEDPNLTKLPFDVLKEVVDFKTLQKDDESFQKVYSFCLNYLDEHHENVENCSELFSTLDTSILSYEDLSKLVGKPYFNREKINDSLGQTLAKLLFRTKELPNKVKEMEESYKNDLKDMKEREEVFKKEDHESKLLRKELEKEKNKVAQLEKQVLEIRDAVFPFLKEARQLHEDYVQDKKERDKKEKEELERKKKEKEINKAKVPLYYPDWSNNQSIGWSSTNAPGDGWMCVQSGCSNYSSPCYVTVAGKKTFIVSGCSSGYTYSSVFFPIRNGQSLSYNTGSTTSSSAYFLKNRTSSVVIMPDWEQATLKQWNQQYTAECDGWLYADTGSNGNQGYLQMNNTLNIYVAQQNNGYLAYSSIFVPIASGDTFRFYHGYLPGPCFFIPGKKNIQVGMPDWDKESGQSWNTKYEATEPGWIYAQCRCYACYNTSTNNNPGYLMVNGIPILISQNNHTSSYYDNASVFIPVSKGDKYNAQGGYANQSISFFPFMS